MKGTCVNRFIGRYCKIITKESGEDRAHVITGIVKGVDDDDGFVLVESPARYQLSRYQNHCGYKTKTTVKPF